MSEDLKDVTIRKQGEYIRYLLKKVQQLDKELKEVKFDRDTYQSLAMCNRGGEVKRGHQR